MRLVRRPAALMAATCLAISGLSACAGQGDGEETSSTTVSPLPGDSTTSSSSSSTSSTSSSSTSTKGGDAAPELPAAAKKHTKDGAVAFAKFYWDEGGEALKSGDTKTISALSANECKVCQTYIDGIEKDAKKGLHADINPTQIGTSKVTEQTENRADYVVTLEANDKRYHLVDSQGKSTGQADPVAYDIQIYVDWEGSRWKVVDTFMFTK